MTKRYSTKIIYYCPMCVERPERPENRDPLSPVISIPKICLSHEAMNSQLTADLKAAKKVTMCKPGESGRDKKNHKESLFNPHRRKKLYEKRSKNQPP